MSPLKTLPLPNLPDSAYPFEVLFDVSLLNTTVSYVFFFWNKLPKKLVLLFSLLLISFEPVVIRLADLRAAFR